MGPVRRDDLQWSGKAPYTGSPFGSHQVPAWAGRLTYQSLFLRDERISTPPGILPADVFINRGSIQRFGWVSDMQASLMGTSVLVSFAIISNFCHALVTNWPGPITCSRFAGNLPVLNYSGPDVRL